MDITKIGSEKIKDQGVERTKNTKVGSKDAKDISDAVSAENLSSTTKTSGQEKVKWSPEASLAQEAVSEAKKSPDVRSEKVAALKAAISEGRYQIDPRKIADRMVESSMEEALLSRNI